MTRDNCPTDLLARGRRNELSSLERRVLSGHLARCPNCRAWQQLGHDFERDALAVPGDAALLQRIAQNVRASSVGPLSRAAPTTSGRRARATRWLILAAVATSAAAAAAATGWRIARGVPLEVEQTQTRNLTQPTPQSNPELVSTEKNLAGKVSPELAARQPETPEDETAQQESTRSIPKAMAAVTVIAASGENALSLYREAQQARRKGEVANAISIFRQLQQSFPRSPEAHLSNVALGGALLESGSARDALLQFDRYLASNGNKSLAAEALYGRARALGALHNRAEERAAWLRLTREFPQSPYSATATHRLKSLE